MNDPYQTDDRPEEAPASGLKLDDFYYVFFRHKWKIVLVFAVSIVVAATVYFATPATYLSEAKIHVKYIIERKASVRSTDNAEVKSLDSRGDAIINTEVGILTSYDLAVEVAAAIGEEKIVGKAAADPDGVNAATVIRDSLRVEVAKNSSTIVLTFRHAKADLVRPVLTQIIETYRKKHGELHRGQGVLDSFFLGQVDILRSRLMKTDEDLKKLREQVNIISLEDDKKAYIERLSKLRNDLMTAEAELAQRQSVWDALRRAPQSVSVPSAPGEPANPHPPVTPEQAAEYLRVCNYIDSLQQNLAGLRQRYTDEYVGVRTTLQILSDQEEQKKKLEAAHPGLGRTMPAVVAASAASPLGASSNAAQLASTELRVTELKSLVAVLTEQFKRVGTEATHIAEIEPKILELERLKRVDEENFRRTQTILDQAKIDDSTGAGKVTGLSEMQAPTPASREVGNLKKPLLLILAFGCFGGFGLAFLWEKLVNRSIKRVVDLERALDLPLFISVPDSRWKAKKPARRSPVSPSGAGGDADRTVTVQGEVESLPWDPKHALRPYFEGLRDRLITYFEVRKMTHKPKLVAVTSCRHGAGVSTMAAGLAATLSETGDGNVLLVDMNIERGAVHPFHQGLPGCALSEALEHTTREPAQIQDNLYVVTAHEGNSSNSSKLPTVLPKRFAHLIPKMKASDYDYIIFDMPPVSQTSVTARLAGFMDMMLLVVESEKTSEDVVKRASGLLTDSRANLATVLNKQRSYVPPALSQEL